MDTSGASRRRRTAQGVPRKPALGCKTFLTGLDELADEGGVFDANLSSVEALGGSATRSLMRDALVFFGLIDRNYRPTSVFAQFRAADHANRVLILEQLGREAYADVIALAERDASAEELEEMFAHQGATGSTAEKWTNFYVMFARYTGLPISKGFKRPRGFKEPLGPQRQERSSESRAELQGPVATDQDPPKSSANSDQLTEYYRLLMTMAKGTVERGEQVPEDLLNRLERTLNIGGQKPLA